MHVPVIKKRRSALIRALFRWRGCPSSAPSVFVDTLCACASIAVGHCEALTTSVSCGQTHDKNSNKRSRDLRLPSDRQTIALWSLGQKWLTVIMVMMMMTMMMVMMVTPQGASMLPSTPPPHHHRHVHASPSSRPSPSSSFSHIII